MIITTTPSIEGRRISGYLGILTGEAIPGANIIRDISASVTDIVGGRSGKYEEELGKARRIALDEIAQEADRLNADAIEGVDLDSRSFATACSWLPHIRNGGQARVMAAGCSRHVFRGTGINESPNPSHRPGALVFGIH